MRQVIPTLFLEIMEFVTCRMRDLDITTPGVTALSDLYSDDLVQQIGHYHLQLQNNVSFSDAENSNWFCNS